MSTNINASNSILAADRGGEIVPDVDEPWLPVVAEPGTGPVLAGAALGAGLLAALLTPSFGVFTAASAVILAAALVVLAFIDFKVHRLPDVIVLPLYVVFTLLNALAAATGEIGWDRFWTAAACMSGAFTFFYVLAVLTGLGFGDVKLSGVLGLVLGVYGVAQVAYGALLVPVILAGFAAFALLLMGRPGKSEFAFGPYMAIGSLAILLHPQAVGVLSGGVF